jgi:site-specific recombinase XerD
MAIVPVKGGWRVDCQPGGRGAKRIRKTFKRKADAVQFERELLHKADAGEQWQRPQKDNRRLSDLVKLWFDLHGVNLKARNTYPRLLAMVEAMGNPFASAFDAGMFADYRSKRISQGLKPSTLNRERSYLAAVFGELIRLGHWKGENPLSKVRPVKVIQPELSFLSRDQICLLFEALGQAKNPDVFLVVRLCLATGARWSEVYKLRPAQIRVNPGLVTFCDTKGGKDRSVPVDEELIRELFARLSAGPFKSCYSAFRSAVKRTGIDLPDGQLSHVLRHTFASHFVQSGGDLLTLQRILGHSSITVTMRYAHLAPNHLDQARKLNPLSALTLG